MVLVKIKKILVPMDGSKYSFRGLDEAIYIARQCGATLTGLYVVPFYPHTLNMPPVLYRKNLAEEGEKILSEAKRRSAQNGVVFEEKIAYGKVASEILDFANSKKFDLIVIGSRGLGAVNELFLGSVANAIVHKSKIPVFVSK